MNFSVDAEKAFDEIHFPFIASNKMISQQSGNRKWLPKKRYRISTIKRRVNIILNDERMNICPLKLEEGKAVFLTTTIIDHNGDPSLCNKMRNVNKMTHRAETNK